MIRINKNLKIILLIFISICTFCDFACEKVSNPPTESQIKQWWKSKENIDVLKVVPVKLTNKETAFIAQVYFTERGRNFFNGALLVRPLLKETREIDDLIGATEDAFTVMDLDNDGVSEIITKAVGSGQGTTSGSICLISFNGWNTVILYESEFGDNSGDCGEISLKKCYSTEIDWKFEDIDGDGTLDLVETIIEAYGLDSEDMQSNEVVKKFLFKEGKLSPYKVQ